MARKRRLCTDEALKLPVHSLLERGRIRPGKHTSGWLIDKSGPRYSAFLGHDFNGWIRVNDKAWKVQRYDLANGGFRLYTVGENGNRHRDLFLTNDGRLGTATEINLGWTTKRLKKRARELYRRRKLFQRLQVHPGDLDWVRAHFDYPVQKPKGMWSKTFRRLLAEGIRYKRWRMRNRDREVLEKELQALQSIFTQR